MQTDQMTARQPAFCDLSLFWVMNSSWFSAFSPFFSKVYGISTETASCASCETYFSILAPLYHDSDGYHQYLVIEIENVLPAWNDDDLLTLIEMLFLAFYDARYSTHA